MDNNNVEIGGEIVEELEFSHEIYDEKFNARQYYLKHIELYRNL